MIIKKSINTQIAYKVKSNFELKKHLWFFKLMQFGILIRFLTNITPFLLKINFPFSKTIIKNTIFSQFCGGETKTDCIKTIEKLSLQKVYSVLDYSVEGNKSEKAFEETTKQLKRLILFSENNKQIPFNVFKPSAIGRVEIFEKVGSLLALTNTETEEWKRIENRFDSLCQLSEKIRKPILIDAEESWMQNAVDILSEKMMKQYNKQTAIVYNTVQMYRWDRMEYIKTLHQKALKIGFKVGLKIVRGAYLEKEKERALKKGYKSPICATKSATDNNFNEGLKYLLQDPNIFSVFIATHNEQSNQIATELIKTKHTSYWFGQLFGMCDHITFNLATKGFQSSKYIPYGPLKKVIPYLVRRVKENSSVTGQSAKEVSLLKIEIKRRQQL